MKIILLKDEIFKDAINIFFVKQFDGDAMNAT